MDHVGGIVDGIERVSPNTFIDIDPSTGGAIATITASSALDVAEAVTAARRAFDKVSGKAPSRERGRVLRQIADALAANRSELAITECRDTGNPLREAYTDVGVATTYFEPPIARTWRQVLKHRHEGRRLRVRGARDRSILQNAGQSCSAGSRLLVKTERYDEVVNAVAARMASASVGRGLADPNVGPLIAPSNVTASRPPWRILPATLSCWSEATFQSCEISEAVITFGQPHSSAPRPKLTLLATRYSGL